MHVSVPSRRVPTFFQTRLIYCAIVIVFRLFCSDSVLTFQPSQTFCIQHRSQNSTFLPPPAWSFQKCTVMMDSLLAYPLHVLRATFPRDKHQLGPILMQMVISKNVSWTEWDVIFEMLPSCNSKEFAFGNFGFVHGALQHAIGVYADSYSIWPYFLDRLCKFGLITHVFLYQCLHGMGHGVLLNSLVRNRQTLDYSACRILQDNSIALHVMEIVGAEMICLAAPTKDLAYCCSDGMYHAMIQWWPMQSTKHRAFSVCMQSNTPAPCFFRVTYNGLFKQKLVLIGDIERPLVDCTSLVNQAARRTEGLDRSCIFAVSVTQFPNFVIGRNSLAGRFESIKRWNPRLSEYSSTWCSALASKGSPKTDLYHARFLACVHGCMFHTSFGTSVMQLNKTKLDIAAACDFSTTIVDRNLSTRASKVCIFSASLERQIGSWVNFKKYFIGILE